MTLDLLPARFFILLSGLLLVSSCTSVASRGGADILAGEEMILKGDPSKFASASAPAPLERSAILGTALADVIKRASLRSQIS